jgi:hypothetical protein
MKIGGIINQEFKVKKLNKKFLTDGTFLINGRSALLLILLEIKKKYKINKILIPYFTCHSVVNAIKFAKFKFDYYDFNIKSKNIVLNREKKIAVLLIHYFGWRNDYIKFSNNNVVKIEDYSHLFLKKKFLKRSKNSYIFASLRKHSHLQYGAWVNKKFDISEIDNKTKKKLITNQKKLFLINDKDKFQIEAEKFNKVVQKKYILKKLSFNLKNNFLKVDWQFIKNRRIKNSKYLKNNLNKFSKLNFLNLKNNYLPLNFFLLTKKRTHLKKFLFKKGIYTSIHWKIKNDKRFKFSSKLSNQILSLPIDQRYDFGHMRYILENLKIYDKNF